MGTEGRDVGTGAAPGLAPTGLLLGAAGDTGETAAGAATGEAKASGGLPIGLGPAGFALAGGPGAPGTVLLAVSSTGAVLEVLEGMPGAAAGGACPGGLLPAGLFDSGAIGASFKGSGAEGFMPPDASATFPPPR